jgi:small subunit ribosomal protein S6e
MVFKINIAEKTGKTFKLELDGEGLVGKELYDKISGKEISSDLGDYEFEITGASDKAGFTAMKNVEGIGLKKVLLSYEKAMKNRPKKEGKKKRTKLKPKGLRLRKTVRGKVISPEIVQINLKILKEGGKKLSEVFPEQNKSKEEPKQEEKQQEVIKEPKAEEVKVEKEKPKEEQK